MGCLCCSAAILRDAQARCVRGENAVTAMRFWPIFDRLLLFSGAKPFMDAACSKKLLMKQTKKTLPKKGWNEWRTGRNCSRTRTTGNGRRDRCAASGGRADHRVAPACRVNLKPLRPSSGSASKTCWRGRSRQRGAAKRSRRHEKPGEDGGKVVGPAVKLRRELAA